MFGPALLPFDFFLTQDEDEYFRLTEEIPYDISPYWGLVFYKERGADVATVIVFIRKGREDRTCVHEAVHVWQYALEYMSESTPGKEIEAYAIEKIAQYLLSYTS